MGTEGRFGSHAGSRMATEPAQTKSALTRVLDQDGFRWGLLGTPSDIVIYIVVPKDGCKARSLAKKVRISRIQTIFLKFFLAVDAAFSRVLHEPTE